MVHRSSLVYLLLTGCQLQIDYSGTVYRCTASRDCPVEHTCVAEVCTPVGEANETPDAAPLPEAPPAGDAGSPDAAGDPGEDAGADATPLPDAGLPDATNLLADPGFESGVDGWIGYLGTAARTASNPHSGTHALLVCKDSTGRAGFFSVYRDVLVGRHDLLPPGARYRAQMFVRAAERAPDLLKPMLRERGGASPFLNHYGEALAPVTLAWTPITVDAVVEAGDRTGLSFVLEAGNEDDGTCFAIDDVYIFRVD